RDKHIAAIAKDGRLQWQAATGYGKRALIETAIGRYKGLIGRRVRARSHHPYGNVEENVHLYG
ncbi:IS5/IS1182 family transposase, partial [Sinorhizobium medicae]|nr:IS5/IS1182 family transposase [Sinorhizobium medicae]MDX0581050.1 IS5/IS1182 family transposase [Sinorhizobium medicae]MDX0784414.1 IS5/IS1182 family transposase [Sinorhizobium medicae]